MRWPLFFPLPRHGACLDLLVVISLITVVWYLVGGARTNSTSRGKTPSARPQESAAAQRPCQQLSGASETVVVIKTSAAELEDRLPIHFETTLLCYPNYLIFSDWAETYKNHSIQDALSSVSQKLRSFHPDLELWRRLRTGGPDVLEDEEIWQSTLTTRALDKWKILPMISQALADHPGLEWYVFLETDTFVLWSNLLAWLKDLDFRNSHYIGSTNIGSGFILSRAAIKALVERVDLDRSAYERLTGTLPAGDAVLSQALNDVGIGHEVVSVTLDTASPGSLDHDEGPSGKRRWCRPAVSYHGVSPAMTAELWNFEQQWLLDRVRHTHSVTNSMLTLFSLAKPFLAAMCSSNSLNRGW